MIGVFKNGELMKILFLVSHLNGGGAERTVSYLSDYISKKNDYEVTILSISDEMFYPIGEKVNLVKLGIPSSSKNFIEKIRNIVLRFIRVRKALKKYKPDVVFCMLARVAKYLPMHRKKYKIICSERSNPKILTNNKSIREREYVLSNCDGIVFQTERAKNCYSRNIVEKGIVIQNAVGNPYVYKINGIKNRRNTICSVGRLSYEKDYPTLFKAFKIVKELYPSFELEIYGDGVLKQELVSLATKMQIGESVKFMGVKPDAIVEIADSMCFVLTSMFEGMPNALMEAMAVGLPCVSTDCQFGPRELIEDGENGILVEVGDYKSVSNAIIKFIEDRDFAQKCSKNARGILVTNSVDKIAEQYLDFINKVVSAN